MPEKKNTFETITLMNGEVVNRRHYELEEDEAFVFTVKKSSDINAYKHKQEINNNMRELTKSEMGGFFHMIYKYKQPIFEELRETITGDKANIHMVRFLVLAAHLYLNGDSDKNKVKKSSLKKIWDTENRNGINETYDLLLKCGYISESEEKYITINTNIAVYGKVNIKSLKKEDADYTYIRVYCQTILDLYYGTEAKKRKQLANLFMVLPYINFKHNVFCSNPTETDKFKLQPLNWTDLAKLCGYESNKNIARFKKDLRYLKIYGHYTIGQFTVGDNDAIVINPKIYYGGDDVEDIRRIFDLFDMLDK